MGVIRNSTSTDDNLHEPIIMLIDVRTPDEYNEAHHDGAVNIPIDEIETRVFDNAPDTEMILYCRSGGRAGRAKDALEKRGFINVSLLNGTGAY